MTNEPQVLQTDSEMTVLRKGDPTPLIRWFPAGVLFLYVLGFVTANGHYGRFEMIKPTLLTGRYLSAGLLYMVFAAVPAAAGFSCFLQIAAERKRRPAWQSWLLVAVYALSVVVYAFFISNVLTIESMPWRALVFMGGTALAGAFACWEIVFFGAEDVQDLHMRVLYRASKLATHTILMIGAAVVLGAWIYPSIPPHFGGAAVLERQVTLTSDAPEELHSLLGRMPVPFVDLDETFLYVLACPIQSDSTKPAVIMVPLRFLAAGRMQSQPTRFVAVPDYIKKHGCGIVSTPP